MDDCDYRCYTNTVLLGVFELMNIRVSIISSQGELDAALQIRRTVFVDEQNVPEEIEVDEFEDEATHIIAVLDGEPVGTARWKLTASGIKLERFAVLPIHRGKGIGAVLVREVLDHVLPAETVYLHAQEEVIPFYEQYGFETVGEKFEEAGITHRKMVLRQ